MKTSSVLTFGGCLLVVGCGQEKTAEPGLPVRPVKMHRVQASGIASTQSFPGTTAAGKGVELSFQVNGRIIDFLVSKGDILKKGDVVARLDPKLYEENLKKAQADIAKARADFERQQRLYENQAIAAAQLDVARQALEVAQTAAETARKNLADTVLAAPFEGVVATTYVDQFQDISPPTPVIRLENIDQIEITVNVPEALMIRRAGGRLKSPEELNKEIVAQADFASLPGRSFPVEILNYESRADEATRTFAVTLVMDRPENANILPGMTARVTVTENRAVTPELGVGGPVVPVTAVFGQADGRPAVWVLEPVNAQAKKATRRAVQIGDVVGGMIQITEGLKADEIVATAGVNDLVEGQLVKEFSEAGFR